MKREVSFVCEGCSIGYACESDALDCEIFCKFIEKLRGRGLDDLVTVLESYKTPKAAEIREALEIHYDEYRSHYEENIR
jgi:hypothetical protein